MQLALGTSPEDFVATPFGEIRGRDLHSLRPQAWLNDTVVDRCACPRTLHAQAVHRVPRRTRRLRASGTSEVTTDHLSYLLLSGEELLQLGLTLD